MNSISLIDGHVDGEKGSDKEILKAMEMCMGDEYRCKRCSYYSKNDTKCYEKLYKDVLSIMNRYEEAEKRLKHSIKLLEQDVKDLSGEWIKAEERLPKELYDVLIYDSENEFMCIAALKNGEWYNTTISGTDIIDGVTHWRELPGVPENPPVGCADSLL